jgi:hypothetical protein
MSGLATIVCHEHEKLARKTRGRSPRLPSYCSKITVSPAHRQIVDCGPAPRLIEPKFRKSVQPSERRKRGERPRVSRAFAFCLRVPSVVLSAAIELKQQREVLRAMRHDWFLRLFDGLPGVVADKVFHERIIKFQRGAENQSGANDTIAVRKKERSAAVIGQDAIRETGVVKKNAIQLLSAFGNVSRRLIKRPAVINGYPMYFGVHTVQTFVDRRDAHFVGTDYYIGRAAMLVLRLYSQHGRSGI